MPKRFSRREENKGSRRHDKSELSPGHMASVQAQVFASAKEKSSWIRLLSYICAHNRLPFLNYPTWDSFSLFHTGNYPQVVQAHSPPRNKLATNWRLCFFSVSMPPTKQNPILMSTLCGHAIFLCTVTASSNTRDCDVDFLRIILIHFQSG